MEPDQKLQTGDPGSELLKQSNRLSDLVSEKIPTILSAFTKEVRDLHPAKQAETDKLSLNSNEDEFASEGRQGNGADTDSAGGDLKKSDSSKQKSSTAVGDVESHYNYNQYTTAFVHSLQT